MCLLAAEITAVTGKNPQEHYNELAARFGAPSYNRLQASATSAQKAALSKLSPENGKCQHAGGRSDHRSSDGCAG